MFQATQRHRYHDSNRGVGVVGSRMEEEVGRPLDGGRFWRGGRFLASHKLLGKETLGASNPRRKGARTTLEQYPPRSDDNNNKRLQGSGLIEKI